MSIYQLISLLSLCTLYSKFIKRIFFSPATHSELKLEFGYDVPISSNPKTVVVMKNNSAISASFSIYIDHFKGGRLPTPPEKKRPGILLLFKNDNLYIYV